MNEDHSESVKECRHGFLAGATNSVDGLELAELSAALKVFVCSVFQDTGTEVP